MAFKDLREWIAKLESEGELARVKEKVDWDLEIGGITQKVFDEEGPALLFENIKGHEDTLCKKLFTASLSTYPRIALAMGLPKDTPARELIKILMERVREPVKPVLVEKGAVKENILEANDVDLFQFPAPRWHDLDGGRYIGTFDGVVTKDPETGWQNIGLYRRMIHDRNHTGIAIIHGQHVWMHWRKNRKLGNKTMPIAVVNGWDPVLPMVSCSSQPVGVCEYDIMGAIRQKPVELVKCETVDLEVPADAEIVFEGEVIIDFDQFRMEGPFGEYSGYYGSTANKKPVVRWNCITHRNDPMLQGTLEGVPINEDHRVESINFSALLWEHLNSQMVGVTGVNVHPSTGWANVIIQIDNSYIGQVQQAAFGIWALSIGAHVGKNIIVVDTDIDIFDLNKISWAIAYRVEPRRDIHMITGSIGSTDPVKHPDERVGVTIAEGTRMIVDATKYFGHNRTEKWFGQKFAPVCYPDDNTMELVNKRWKEYGI